MSSRGTPSTEETDILRARSHGVDEFFGSVIPHQNDELQQATAAVESEAELPPWVLIVE